MQGLLGLLDFGVNFPLGLKRDEPPVLQCSVNRPARHRLSELSLLARGSVGSDGPVCSFFPIVAVEDGCSLVVKVRWWIRREVLALVQALE